MLGKFLLHDQRITDIKHLAAGFKLPLVASALEAAGD